jgi:hypothetical protein
MSCKRKILRFLAILGALSAVATLPSTRYADAADPYARVSNKDLQRKALGLVKGMRDFVYAYNQKDKDLMTAYQSDYLATRTTERGAVTQQWRTKSDEALRSSLRDYQKNFLSECILIRDELYKRLPKRLQRSNLASLYKNPPNVLAIEAIADDLELLAKSLPDS